MPCSTCGEMFSDKRMRRHVMSKHASNDEKPFKCTLCPKGFLTKITLQEHINTHTGERPNICSFCGIGFVNHSNRRMHERTVHLGHNRSNSNKANVEALYKSLSGNKTIALEHKDGR